MCRIEVLDADGNVRAAGVVCELCNGLRDESEMDVFEGPGQHIEACVPCLVDMDAHCAADPGQPLPWELGADVDADREVA